MFPDGHLAVASPAGGRCDAVVAAVAAKRWSCRTVRQGRGHLPALICPGRSGCGALFTGWSSGSIRWSGVDALHIYIFPTCIICVRAWLRPLDVVSLREYPAVSGGYFESDGEFCQTFDQSEKMTLSNLSKVGYSSGI